MSRSCRYSSFILPLVVSTILAGPKIKFDARMYNAGFAEEGKTEIVNAHFAVKNIGDSVLKLESVRPGCSCTSVKYDTLIQPGKTARIAAAVNLKGFPGGLISKSITVTSNAENEPIVRLTVRVTNKAFIEISERYISLNINDVAPESLYFSSKMSGLEVTEIVFVKDTDHEVTPDWQSDLPLPIKYAWLPTDSMRNDGYRVYKLKLFMPEIDRSVLGVFIIKTNHPGRPEIIMRGTLLI
ncbi:MAG: DUF1573 domain-containing protein [Chitinispirillaceae bacterium]|nr:DUF1573 domain-containing protein [Chitinispirillaceae bacterium]